MTDNTRSSIVFTIQHIRQNIDQRLIGGGLFLLLHILLMLGDDLLSASDELKQRLALAPGIPATVLQFFLVFNSFLKFVRMAFGQHYPFVLPLEETESATGAGAPTVISRHADAAFFEDAHDAFP